MADSNPLRDQIITAAKECFQRAAATMLKRFEEFDGRLKAISLTPGPKGEPGERGEKGLDGAASTEPGPQGEPGATGEAGPPGPQGSPGEQGESIKGDAGIAGPQGAEGKSIEGPQGPQGEAGLSIKGDPGDLGPQGVEGKSIEGPQGPQGASGVSVKGDAGDMGPQGERGIGEKGIDGRDGRDGAAGEPGRDALEIDVRDGIDEAKSYPRGTFATHNGGMIRAFKSTLPLKGADSLGAAGWQVIVNGISDVQTAHSDDFRSLGMAIQTTDGKMFVIERSYPAMVYCGVFADGVHRKGDVVTWGGSAWHCQVEKTEAQPGTSDDWRLMVKNGRPGKDGAPGERGPEGRAGKDLRP